MHTLTFPQSFFRAAQIGSRFYDVTCSVCRLSLYARCCFRVSRFQVLYYPDGMICIHVQLQRSYFSGLHHKGPK